MKKKINLKHELTSIKVSIILCFLFLSIIIIIFHVSGGQCKDELIIEEIDIKEPEYQTVTYNLKYNEEIGFDIEALSNCDVIDYVCTPNVIISDFSKNWDSCGYHLFFEIKKPGKGYCVVIKMEG